MGTALDVLFVISSGYCRVTEVLQTGGLMVIPRFIYLKPFLHFLSNYFLAHFYSHKALLSLQQCATV